MLLKVMFEWAAKAFVFSLQLNSAATCGAAAAHGHQPEQKQRHTSVLCIQSSLLMYK